MTRDHGLWKTGVLAVAGTLIFAFIIFRAAERSREPNVDAPIPGQPFDAEAGITGGATVTRIMPQIVAGSYDGERTRYKTTIEILNPGNAAIDVSANFYNADGTASTVVKRTSLDSTPTVTALLPRTTVAANGIFLIIAEEASMGNTGWARIVATAGAVVSGYIELRDTATGVLHNRLGIASSPADMARFVVPWVRNVTTGLDTAFAIVNTGASAASITGTIRDSVGMVVAGQTISLPPGNHTATFTGQLFSASGCSPCLSSDVPAEITGDSYGSVTFTSASSQFAAMGLSVQGTTLSTAPLERIQ